MCQGVFVHVCQRRRASACVFKSIREKGFHARIYWTESAATPGYYHTKALLSNQLPLFSPGTCRPGSKPQVGAKIRKYKLGGPVRKLDQIYARTNLRHWWILRHAACWNTFINRFENQKAFAQRKLILACKRLRHLFKHFLLQDAQVIKPSCHGKRTTRLTAT